MTPARIIPFPAHRIVHEPSVDKKRIAAMLGFSVRWVELRTAEGMPSTRSPNGHRRYRLSECLAWLDERAAS